MAITKYVTQDTVDYYEAMLTTDRFILMNMSSEGIWLVDKEHSDFEKIKETAINIAKHFGDKKALETLNKQ